MKKLNKKPFIFLIIAIVGCIILNHIALDYLLPMQTLQYDSNGYIEFQQDPNISEITSFSKIDEVSKSMLYKDFIEDINDSKITEVYSEFDNSKYSKTLYCFKADDDTCYRVENPQNEGFKKTLLEHNVKVYGKAHIFERLGYQTPTFTFDINAISGIFSLMFMGLMIFYIYTMAKSSNVINSGTEPTSTKTTKTFDDIGGLYELKKDLMSLVDFIKNADKYKESGAKLPSGVLLVGPPGTGKTLIAKAIAQEAKVPFYSASGSDFVEMFVGRGAARIRELFKTARKNTPCIIFIDELDTLCSKRSDVNGHSEDRKTLTALLTEMDGFKTDSGILVIGATNRIEDIDSAVLRPGRFTEIYHVPYPETMEERMDIIKIYTRDKKFAEDVDFKVFAKEMIGRSPAEIESVLNESAIISVQKNLPYINKECIDEAVYKRIMKGHQKNNKEADYDELKMIAFHEAGHALMGKLNHHEVTKITILPSTSGAGGVTFIQPDDKRLYTKKMFYDKIKELYGGVIGEYLFNGRSWDAVSTGCSNDIECATEYMKNMIEVYGMSNAGLVNMKVLDNRSDAKIKEEIIQLSEKLKEETIKDLEKNYDKLEALANALLEKETLHEKEIENIINLSN